MWVAPKCQTFEQVGKNKAFEDYKEDFLWPQACFGEFGLSDTSVDKLLLLDYWTEFHILLQQFYDAF